MKLIVVETNLRIKSYLSSQLRELHLKMISASFGKMTSSRSLTPIWSLNLTDEIKLASCRTTSTCMTWSTTCSTTWPTSRQERSWKQAFSRVSPEVLVELMTLQRPETELTRTEVSESDDSVMSPGKIFVPIKVSLARSENEMNKLILI